MSRRCRSRVAEIRGAGGGHLLAPEICCQPGSRWTCSMRGCERAISATGTAFGADKGSTRWLEGSERFAEMAAEIAATRLGYVATRVADLLAMLAHASAGNPIRRGGARQANSLLDRWQTVGAFDRMLEHKGDRTHDSGQRRTFFAHAASAALDARSEYIEREGRNGIRHLHPGARNRRSEERQADCLTRASDRAALTLEGAIGLIDW